MKKDYIEEVKDQFEVQEKRVRAEYERSYTIRYYRHGQVFYGTYSDPEFGDKEIKCIYCEHCGAGHPTNGITAICPKINNLIYQEIYDYL